MDVASYKEHWNRRANSAENAVAAVDGSSSEGIVRHTGRWTAAQVQAALDIGTDDDVLELGCGVGRIGRELADSCRHWTGVDISDSMIDHASERLTHLDNVSFHRLEHSSLEMLADDSIDKAYSIAVFCHMDKEDLYLYLQELMPPRASLLTRHARSVIRSYLQPRRDGPVIIPSHSEAGQRAHQTGERITPR